MDNPNGTAGVTTTTYHCMWCGGPVNPIALQQHICDWSHRLSPTYTPPASPIAPDARLIPLQEQIAKALERIADALEGLKK